MPADMGDFNAEDLVQYGAELANPVPRFKCFRLSANRLKNSRRDRLIGFRNRREEEKDPGGGRNGEGGDERVWETEWTTRFCRWRRNG